MCMYAMHLIFAVYLVYNLGYTVVCSKCTAAVFSQTENVVFGEML